MRSRSIASSARSAASPLWCRAPTASVASSPCRITPCWSCASVFAPMPRGGTLSLRADATPVVLDESSGGGENLGSGAEILTEVDDRRAGVELREAKEVVGRATSPPEHRLVVIGGERQCRRSPIARCSAIEGHHQEFNEPLLKEIQILALVDQ